MTAMNTYAAPIVNCLLVLAGLLIIIGNSADMFLTIIHLEPKVWISKRISAWLWNFWKRLAAVIVRIGSKFRRVGEDQQKDDLYLGVLSLSAPLTVVVLIFLWVAFFVIGFALVYTPILGEFRLGGTRLTGCISAFYLSGQVFLAGSADLMPRSSQAKLLSGFENFLGMVTLAIIITHVFNIYSITDKVGDLYQIMSVEQERLVGRLLDVESLGHSVRATMQKTVDLIDHCKRFPAAFFIIVLRTPASLLRTPAPERVLNPIWLFEELTFLYDNWLDQIHKNLLAVETDESVNKIRKGADSIYYDTFAYYITVNFLPPDEQQELLPMLRSREPDARQHLEKAMRKLRGTWRSPTDG